MAINYEPVVLMGNRFDNESAWSKFWLGVVVAVFLDRRTSMVNYLFECRHLLISSDLLFSDLSLLAVIMKYFSHRHNWHRLVALEYVLHCLMMVHLMLCSMSLSFRSHTYLLRIVSGFFFLC